MIEISTELAVALVSIFAGLLFVIWRLISWVEECREIVESQVDLIEVLQARGEAVSGDETSDAK